MPKYYEATKRPGDDKNIDKEKDQNSPINPIDMDDRPKPNMFRETTMGDSSLYDPYNLRPYNPDDLYQKRGNYDLFDEMRQDDQIAAVLTLKKFFILNGTREIQSENPEVKEFLEHNLDYGVAGFFDKMLYNILSAIDFGFSITEKIFKLVDTPEFGQRVILYKLKTRPPHPFEFDQDKKGNITRIRQDWQGGQDVVIDPEKVIHYVFQNEFDNPYGQSDLNMGVYRAWWSKNAIIKFWNIYLERFGMPLAVGKYPQGSVQYTTDFKNALKNMQAKTSVIIPEGFEIDFMQAQRGGEAYEKAIDKYNTMIARKMLVPDLMGMSGAETGGGSFALGKSQFDMFYNNINHERKNLERIINKEIIFPLVLWNFGSGEHAELRFSQPDQEKRDRELTMWLDSVKSGKIPITNEHINWFLKQVNAPEIEEEELNRIEEEKKAMALEIGGGQPGMPPKPGEKPQKDPMDAKEIEKREKKKAKKPENKPDKSKDVRKDIDKKAETKKFTKYYRELTQYEKRVDFDRMDRDESLIVTAYTIQLSNFFRIVVNGLIDDIRKKKIVEGKKFDLIDKLRLKGESRFAKILLDLSKDSYKSGTESVEVEIKKFNLVKSSATLDTEDIIKAFEQHAFNTASNEYQHILSRVKSILIESIRSGEGARETVKMIDEELKGYDQRILIDNADEVLKMAKDYGYNSTDELFANLNKVKPADLEKLSKWVIPIDSKTGKFRLETIVRTTHSTAVNEARLQRFDELAKDGVIVAYQYSAIRDQRTSDLCASLDKKIFPVSEAQYYSPPNHYNCRSLLVPVFEFEEYEFTEMPATKKTKGNFLELQKVK